MAGQESGAGAFGKPGKGRFLAVGHNGLRSSSADGIQWSTPQFGKDGETYRAAASGNGRCVAVGAYGGSNLFATTQDGEKWSVFTRDAHYSAYLLGLGFASGTFLGVGGDPGAVGAGNPFVLESTDGVQWSEPISISGKFVLRRLSYGNGRWVGVGDRGRRATSKDGHHWDDAPDVRALDTLVDLTFGNGVFVGVGLHGLRRVSEDGLRWSPPQRGEEGEHLNSVVWTGSRFVAVGLGGTYTSADGHAWERAPNQDAPLCVAYGRGVFVGSNWKGRLMRSTDGIRWEQTHRMEQHVEAVAFAEVG